jgi:hypothetical protein
MATSADREDHDEDEKDEAEESPKASAKKKDEKAGSAEDRPAKASGKAAKAVEEEEGDEEEDEEDDGEEEEEEEEDGDEEEAAAKPTSKRTAAKSAAKDDEEEDEEDQKPAPKRRGPGARPAARGPGASRAKQAPAPAQGGSLGKSVLLFVVIVVGLGAGFAILGREPPAEQARPKWKTGEVADIEVTLVPSDRQDLACASDVEIAGRHCAFEAPNKPWSKGGDLNDDKKLLKPYTTAPPDHIQFAAAGLWSEPALAKEKLPATRFSVKCKYKVEGTLKSLSVRWEQTGNWYPQNEWYTGTLSDCKLSP